MTNRYILRIHATRETVDVVAHFRPTYMLFVAEDGRQWIAHPGGKVTQDDVEVDASYGPKSILVQGCSR